MFSQQNAKKRKLEDGGEEDMGECRKQPPVTRHLRHLAGINGGSLSPLNSEWHQGLRHARRDDEEQRESC